MFLYYVFLLVCVPFDIWMRIKALCFLKYRTSIIHMITLPYTKNVDIKECMNIWCMKFKMLAELSLQQRCSPSYLSVSAFNQRGVVNTFMKWGLGPQTSLTPPLLIALSLPNKDCDRSCYLYQGRIQDFKLGGAHLKKLRRAEGDANIFGVFRVKNHDFTPKNQIFFPILGEGGARRVPPLGSAPVYVGYWFSYWNFEFFDDVGYFIFHFIRSTIYITGPAKFDMLLKNRVTFDIWAYVLYVFIMEKNVPAMTYALKKSSNSNFCIRKFGFDLHPLCDLNLLTNYPDISGLIKYFLMCDCDFTTLSTHTGDKYIHAAVKITFATSKLM